MSIGELARGFALDTRADVEGELERLDAASDEAKMLAAKVVELSAETLIRRAAGMPSPIQETALNGARLALVSAAGEAALGGVQTVLTAALRRAAQIAIGIAL